MKPASFGKMALLLTIAVALLSLSTHSVSADSHFSFDPGCPIPFGSLFREQPIDSACNRFGESGSYAPPNEAQRISNAAKNNLCAVGPPIPLVMEDFRELMRAVEDADIPFGPGRLPTNRDALRDLTTKEVPGRSVPMGEGSLVVFRGFVSEAKYGAVESVNCRRKGVKNSDIHIGLVARKSDFRCKGIIAEMIPHYRPKAWTPSAIKKIKHPVRVTGALFFDAPHVPCDSDGTIRAGNPQRASLWEIHPVYSFEVCENTTLAACRIDNDDDWISLGGG